MTIQNHGSYTVEDYPAEVQLADEPGAYPKAEQYLTLANKTDEAVSYTHLFPTKFRSLTPGATIARDRLNESVPLA